MINSLSYMSIKKDNPDKSEREIITMFLTGIKERVMYGDEYALTCPMNGPRCRQGMCNQTCQFFITKKELGIEEEEKKESPVVTHEQLEAILMPLIDALNKKTEEIDELYDKNLRCNAYCNILLSVCKSAVENMGGTLDLDLTQLIDQQVKQYYDNLKKELKEKSQKEQENVRD